MLDQIVVKTSDNFLLMKKTKEEKAIAICLIDAKIEKSLKKSHAWPSTRPPIDVSGIFSCDKQLKKWVGPSVS